MTYEALIRKYNIPVPRYTSYPTVPFWEAPMSKAAWLTSVDEAVRTSKRPISLYIHIPYCDKLCTYCGCNTRITKNKSVDKPYGEYLLKEWQMYLEALGQKPEIGEVHFGGGTPTFFSPEWFKGFLSELLAKVHLAPEFEMSFEAHPNSTTQDHLQVLYDLGARRVSFGIQDFDPKVQQAINRIQTYEDVRVVTEAARKVGYTSINYDIIYGLPFQSWDSVYLTMHKISQLMPERIAFYSYAHVPWKRPGQRAYSEEDLPTEVGKRTLYELGKSLLNDLGYHEIGMDHFALPGDALLKAQGQKSLHRNFMGFTPGKTDVLIGLGASSISEIPNAYRQNKKSVEAYRDDIMGEGFEAFKGMGLSQEDTAIKTAVLSLICNKMLSLNALGIALSQDQRNKLTEMEEEGLIEFQDSQIKVTNLGNVFIRNICAVFDTYIPTSQEMKFSKSI